MAGGEALPGGDAGGLLGHGAVEYSAKVAVAHGVVCEVRAARRLESSLAGERAGTETVHRNACATAGAAEIVAVKCYSCRLTTY